jgi:glycosyltransferase involved in cell wall biosynthesis
VTRKFAFFGRPYLGGINSVFHAMRAGLAPHGIALRRIGVTTEGKPLHGDPDGTCIAHDRLPARFLSEQVYSAVMDGGFDGIFINVPVDPVTANMARYLPAGMMKLMIVHGISDGAYLWSRAIREHVHHTIAISPRIRNDLIARHGFDPGRITMIPHGVQSMFHARGRPPASGGPLRVIFAGRLADHDKGCLWIPDILAAAGGQSFQLTIAGEGGSRAALENALSSAPFPVRFTGSVSQETVADLYRSHDVLLAPSRAEGFGLVLAEAMACGCVPVASRIRGVTDDMVTDGDDGLLFPIGGIAAAGAALRRLTEDRPLLAHLSKTAIRTAQDRFSVDGSMAAYVDVIDRTGHALPPIAPVADMARWRMARGFAPRWRSHLPEPVKVWLRTARERLR